MNGRRVLAPRGQPLNLLPPQAYSLLMKVFYDRRLKARVRTLLDPREGLKVLDVACGAGDLFDVTRPCRYVGTDLDLRRVGHASTDSTATHVVSDARALPFRDRSVDRILVAGLFHHLPNAAASAVIAEMARVLRPDGQGGGSRGDLAEPLVQRPGLARPAAGRRTVRPPSPRVRAAVRGVVRGASA